MASKLPYISRPGVITKILPKIKAAQTPDRFTYDFLETKLGCKGGNYQHFVSLAKKLGLLSSDGRPTELYKKFRNVTTSKAAIAHAMKIGYSELFERNEYANSLDREKLKGLVVEITGLEVKNQIVSKILLTFETLKTFSDFETKLADSMGDEETVDETDIATTNMTETGSGEQDIDLQLSYTINLVLPRTDDPAVFNAIFRALRDNLLRK